MMPGAFAILPSMEYPIVTLTTDLGAPDEWVAYVGSAGFLEIAVRDGDAASSLVAGKGTTFTIEDME